MKKCILTSLLPCLALPALAAARVVVRSFRALRRLAVPHLLAFSLLAFCTSLDAQKSNQMMQMFGLLMMQSPQAAAVGEDVYVSKEFGEPYFQVFEMDGSGVLRVSKLGYWVERWPNGARNRSQNVEESVQ